VTYVVQRVAGGCFGEVEIEWRNERRSCLKFSGHYSCKYQECTSCRNLILMEKKAEACGVFKFANGCTAVIAM
jgi:hypothetical protein